MRKLSFTAFTLLISVVAFAQMRYRDSNHIGIIGGVTQTTLTTDDFSTKTGIGWNFGLSVRGNFYNDFDMVYAMQFSENRFSVPTFGSNGEEDVEYKIQGVQIYLTPSYKIVENHLSVELGPVLQVNGKLKYEESVEENIINGLTINVKELENVSTFNIHGLVGVTAGIKNLRASFQYLYGFNNFLNGIKDGDDGAGFKGHLGIISGNLIIYF